jgi:hypothetical protein
VFVRLISHQPAVLFSQNKPDTSNQPTILFSQNKSAPAISHHTEKDEADAANNTVMLPSPTRNQHRLKQLHLA